ncbi:hypothetical protein ACLI1A_03825 [Flavobacterium sp. RHBU_3]|uniref:hypothetical protein n=1 Tax=Flavobacterium sp. RHBU_3 TaxID=3391184 RepID=UPI003984AD22
MRIKQPTLIILLLISFSITQAQEVIDNRPQYMDSIKNSEWPYKLPVWGKKVTKRGVDFPYPMGVMINGMIASQEVTVKDLKVGVNDGDMAPLEFIKFGETKANLNVLNARIDVWAIPFLDFYVIAGRTWAETSVSLVAPVQFSSTVNFSGNTVGAGVTFGGRYKEIFGTIDYNHTWTYFEEIQGAIHTQMVSPRIGHIFQARRKPDRNVGLWVGANGIFLNNTTEGAINMGDLGVNGQIADFDIENTDWYQNLGPAQKVVVKQIADKIKDKLSGIDVSDTTIHYSLKKRPISSWSMSVGGQYQFNHNWQMRTEFGFLGGRKSVLASLNYRFGF